MENPFYKPLSNEIVFRIYFQRGISLPCDNEYEDIRVKEIALKLKELETQFEKINHELTGIMRESGLSTDKHY